MDWNILPAGSLISILIALVVFAFHYWIYRELTKKSVFAAQKDAGLHPRKPIVASVFGGILAFGFGLIFYLFLNGETSHLAKAKAREVYGNDYEYHIYEVSRSGQSVSRKLLAYNDTVIIPLTVQCSMEQQTNEPSRCVLRSSR